ncbi:MAG: type II toxin-antitoxin system RelB/DinJ family antitoxin [Flexilinea sp.]|nr:type II toxin-antitoxin system RelB/DinJ family antitoxin [Flexilinea sp.]
MGNAVATQIRIDSDIKEQAESLFNELGLNMSSAVNIFLRSAIRENGIPFQLKLDEPNETTLAAVEEGDRIAYDKSIKGYNSAEEMLKDLGL